MSSTTPRICVRVKDGKILIAHKGKPFFPEPIGKDVMEIHEGQDAFLIGPYPDKNTMILRFDQYRSMIGRLKNAGDVRSWRITAVVFICMFMVVFLLHLHQAFYSQHLFRHIATLWSKLKNMDILPTSSSVCG